MNIHPIFVHFPIALLSLYSIFEFLRFKRLLELREWFYVKAFFLLFGGAGAILAASTGSFGKPLFAGSESIIRIHERFAAITIIIFGLLCLRYLIKMIDEIFGNKLRSLSCAQTWEYIVRIENKLFMSPVIVILAVLGLFAVLTTGALGASIVYGTSNDIFTELVNKFLVPQ